MTSQDLFKTGEEKAFFTDLMNTSARKTGKVFSPTHRDYGAITSTMLPQQFLEQEEAALLSSA